MGALHQPNKNYSITISLFFCVCVEIVLILFTTSAFASQLSFTKSCVAFCKAEKYQKKWNPQNPM